MNSEKKTILLIESDHEIAERDSVDLKNASYNLITVQSGEKGIQSIRDNADIDLVLMDINPDGEMNGIGVSQSILKIKDIPIIFRVDESYPKLIEESTAVHSYGYVQRSGVNAILIAAIESAVKRFRDKTAVFGNLESDAEILKLFLECNPSYVFFKDSDIKSLKLSKNYEKMLGMPIEELLGKTMYQLFPSDLAKSIDGDDKNIIAEGKPFEIEEELNGHHYSTTKFPIKRADGQTLLAGFSIDITRRVEAENKLHYEIEEHKKAKKELSSFRKYLSNIIDSMPSMLIAVDMNGLVTEWNIESQNKTGISKDDAIGKHLAELIPRFSSDLELVKKAITSLGKQYIQKRNVHEDDRALYEDITIYPLIRNGIQGAVIRVDDVTEKVKMNELMVQSEKMLSVGGLAAGMAHEINNPLAGMIQTSEVMFRRLWDKLEQPANIIAADDSGLDLKKLKKFMEIRKIPALFENLKTSGMRIAEIVNNMLSFSRKSEREVSYTNLNILLDNTLKLAATDYNLKKHYDFKKVKITKDYDNNLLDIPCESPKIQQVLLNLFRNGSEAMEEAGTVELTFYLRTLFEENSKRVVVEIEDNGPGISEENRLKIFEPFFTTKPAGSGTGLGLSVSYFIICENHNGEMIVESEPGQGTKFIIRLPVSRTD